ncbi:MAG: AMP-binding protein [Gemmatimonadaceae bacterium]
MLVRTPGATYDELVTDFRWTLPQRFNMGAACSDRHPPSAPALIELGEDRSLREYSFGDLAMLSNRLANGLAGLGVKRGDRVAIVLPQGVETGIAHLAIYKLGAIAVPMSGLLGPEALSFRLADCDARLMLTDAAHLEPLATIAETMDGTELVCVDGVSPPHHGLWEVVQDSSAQFTPAVSDPDTPALLIYTSGTTGPPKGALHAHRVLLGHLPGFELSHEFFPQENDRFWTPADWAWIGGLMDALIPSWYHGRTVVGAARMGFDPEWALWLMAEHGVRNAFLPPTALKMIRQAQPEPGQVNLRTVMSGGEVLGEEMLTWGREVLGVTINEIYGQTEANYVVGNCASVWEVRPGSMGRPYPGHEVAVLDADSAPAPPGEIGEVAVRAPNPVIFLRYWAQPDATREKFDARGRWMRTGDLATADEEGYLRYESRADDIINSAGYRIGPNEVEQCLMRHPGVAMAAVIGVPDQIRGQAVKAFVVLAEGREAPTEIEVEIQQLVKRRLAAYAYPRELEIVDGLPLTATGKIRRTELREREAGRRKEAER